MVFGFLARPRVAFALALALLTGCAADAVDGPHETAARTLAPALLSVASAAGASTAALTTTRLDFATYDGSREVVHPDVAAFPQGWHGHRYWAVLTPYPNSASRFENPSLFSSEDGDTWGVPAGVTNPLATTKRGYLSDPDMVYEPVKNELWMYYREVVNSKPNTKREKHVADRVWLATSGDGVRWSTPRQVTSDTNKYLVSPTVVREANGSWRMWQVDAGAQGCNTRASQLVVRRSADGVTWSATTPVAFSQAGYMPWHVDVQYVPARHEYWALVAAFVPGQGCTNTSLFLATSPDGTTWTTHPTPVLARGATPQFGRAVYRSTFAYEAGDRVTIWYTGARTVSRGDKKQPPVLAWSAAVSHTTADELLAQVRQAAPAVARLADAPPVRTEEMP